MKRRDSIKAIALGTISTGILIDGCTPGENKPVVAEDGTELFGQTKEEIERDKKIKASTFLTKEELATIAALSDWIIPTDEISGSASEAGVPDFIEFIVKDQPRHQTPIRGGLRWLDLKAYKLYGSSFIKSTAVQQEALLELIAYPDDVLPENKQGANFFSQMRNLVAMGFFSSKMGIADIGYKGNVPNEWDGVPEEVLKQYGLSYDEQTINECLKIEDRGKMMEWKTEG